MADIPPPRPPVELVEPGPPSEPSNRWPWVALGIGLLVIAAAVVFFFVSRPRTVNVNLEGSATVSPVARAGAPSPPPTLVPPTLPASATLVPTPTVASTATPVPPPTRPAPPPTAIPAPTQVPPVVAAAPPPPTQPAQATQPPAATAAAVTGPATAPPASTAAPSPTRPAGPTPFAAQVAGPGGIGNTRADFDAAYGQPTGETPEHLVAYHKGNFDYHVRFVPDLTGRADLLVGVPSASQPLTLEQAMAEAHRLLPRDAQPPNPPPEGNPQFVVERFASQTLGQALPGGQFLVVYVRDPAQATRVTRFIVGPGADPNALINQGR